MPNPLVARDIIAEQFGLDFGRSDKWIALIPDSALQELEAEVARLRTALEQAHALADKWEKSAADSLLLYGVPTTLAPIQAVRELREALRSQDGDTIDG
jgi:hypothetical protein